MAKVELAVYGASNAAGWSVGHGVDYDIARIAEVSYSKPGFVTDTSEKLIIDLSKNPEINEEQQYVVNAAIPGATLPELFEDFERQVVKEKPLHMFFLAGLNDPVLAVTMLHQGEKGAEQTDLADIDEELKGLIAGSADIDSGLRASSEYIARYIKRIADLAQKSGIRPIISTLPPFAHTLLRFEHDPQEPSGKHLMREGRELVNLVNNQIRTFAESTCIIDAYELVVDAATGFTRAEYSYGVSVPESSGDILHLNSFGHIQIATVLCRELQGKPVEVVPPHRDALEQS